MIYPELTKERLETMLNAGSSIQKIAPIFGMTHTGIRYHMKKHKLFSQHLSIQDKIKTPIIDGQKKCSKCQLMKPISNYSNRPYGGLQSACNDCNNNRRYETLKNNLAIIKTEHGGKCIKCGYNKSLVALDFHHRNPSIKLFSLSSPKSISIDELRKEAIKCDLICANCHREEHYDSKNLTPIPSC